MHYLFQQLLHSVLFISLCHLAFPTAPGADAEVTKKSSGPSFQGKILRSADGGDTWENIANGLPAMSIKAARVVDKEVLVGSSLGQLFSRMPDPSGAWSHFDVPINDPFNAHLINSPVVDFYDTKSGVYLSIPEGWLYHRPWGSAKWSAIRSPREKLWVYDVLEDEKGTIFLACLEGIFFSQDKGHSWQQSPFEGHAYDLMFRNGKLLLTGEWGVFQSVDSGRSWTRLNTPNDAMDFTVQDANRYYHSVPSGKHTFVRRQQTAENNGLPGKLLVSYDAGKTWKIHPADTYLKDVHGVSSIVIADDGTIYCSNFSQVIRSTDNGKTWTELLKHDTGNGTALYLELVGGILYCIEASAGC